LLVFPPAAGTRTPRAHAAAGGARAQLVGPFVVRTPPLLNQVEQQTRNRRIDLLAQDWQGIQVDMRLDPAGRERIGWPTITCHGYPLRLLEGGPRIRASSQAGPPERRVRRQGVPRQGSCLREQDAGSALSALPATCRLRQGSAVGGEGLPPYQQRTRWREMKDL